MTEFDDPPYRLKVLSTRILPRLKCLSPFKGLPGLSDEIPAYTERYNEAPWLTLWKCLSGGAPLLLMLDILYPNDDSYCTPTSIEHAPLSDTERRELLKKFASRISFLEKRGQIPYGSEPFKFNAGEFLNKSSKEMIKMLEALERVLREIGKSKPGLLSLPWSRKDSIQYRLHYLIDFSKGEGAYLINIDSTIRPLVDLHHGKRPPNLSPSLNLQELSDHLRLMRTFHFNMKDRIDALSKNVEDNEQWSSLFPSIDSDGALMNAVDAYRTYCDCYPSIIWLLDGWKKHGKPDDVKRVQSLQPLARGPVDSILYYTTVISQLIASTHPIADSMVYNILCVAHVQFQEISHSLIDILYYARSRQASRAIDISRSQVDFPLDPSNFKDLVLDDVVETQVIEGFQSVNRWMYAFLFKDHLMLCVALDEDDKESEEIKSAQNHESLSHPYPVTSWDLGPALRSNKKLTVTTCIPLHLVKKVASSESSQNTLVLLWIMDEKTRMLHLFFETTSQHSRWVVALSQALDISLPYPSINGQTAETEDSESGSVHDRISTSLELLLNGEPLPRGSLSDGVETALQAMSEQTSLLQLVPSPITETPTQPVHQNNDPKAEVPDLTGKITKLSNYAAAGGGFADVWKCEWTSETTQFTVAVKVLRGNLLEGEGEIKLKKRLRNEMEVWQGLSHKNIVPLWGICTDFGKFASFICPWFDQGNLSRFLRQHVDLPMQERLRILLGIAEGLTYLHSFSIVHGDLTSANVLISEDGDACITDFGLSRVAQDLMGSTYMTSVKPGALRWAAPEVFSFNTGESQISTFSDIYSFGCVVFEVLSGLIPYYNLQNDAQVLMALFKKEKTPRPDLSTVTRISDESWRFINGCWDDLPVKRPSIVDVSSQLIEFRL